MDNLAVDYVKDFTHRDEHGNLAKPRKFRIDDDIFETARELPAGVVRKYIELGQKSEEDQIGGFFDMLDMLMLKESAELFAARMLDPDNPISVLHIRDVMQWVIEEYGDRPTERPSNSAASPSPTDTTSMVGAPPAESPLPPSL